MNASFLLVWVLYFSTFKFGDVELPLCLCGMSNKIHDVIFETLHISYVGGGGKLKFLYMLLVVNLEGFFFSSPLFISVTISTSKRSAFTICKNHRPLLCNKLKNDVVISIYIYNNMNPFYPIVFTATTRHIYSKIPILNMCFGMCKQLPDFMISTI